MALAYFYISANQWYEEGFRIYDDGRVVSYWEDRHDAGSGEGSPWTWLEFLEKYENSDLVGYKETAAFLRKLKTDGIKPIKKNH